MFKKIISTVLALALPIFAIAQDVGSPATEDTQTIDVGSDDTGGADDSMTNFMASIADVLVENDRSDNLADDSGNGDDQRDSDRGSRHQRHLGLGFAHGMGNGNGNGNGNPHNDECRGNGHPGNPNGNGNDNGNGHENYNGNGFGHRDCGEPSPSD